MTTYNLKPGPELFPRRDDDSGNRTLKVYLAASATFIQASGKRRGLIALVTQEKGAFLITFNCSKEQLEEIRAEFNNRPLCAAPTRRHP